MHQYSVYIRHCASHEMATVHTTRVKGMVPDEGLVSILKVTDKQFGDTIQFVGKKRKPPPKAPVQLELF
jgi:CRISPR-associated protein Cas2